MRYGVSYHNSKYSYIILWWGYYALSIWLISKQGWFSFIKWNMHESYSPDHWGLNGYFFGFQNSKNYPVDEIQID